jgi:predicted glycosyltransferase involved in capsule biosynthesis
MNNDFTITIPWRDSGCYHRKRHLSFLIEYYSKLTGVILVDSTHEIFNRANSRNECVNQSPTEILMVVDADNFIYHHQIIDGLQEFKKNKIITRPFNSIHYLNSDATERFYQDLDNFSPISSDHEYMPPSNIKIINSGGAYITDKKSWFSIGGMDEKFIDWGLEDLAFNEKYRYYYEDQHIINGPNYNLYHPNNRVSSERNWDRYRMWYQSERIYKENI